MHLYRRINLARRTHVADVSVLTNLITDLSRLDTRRRPRFQTCEITLTIPANGHCRDDGWEDNDYGVTLVRRVFDARCCRYGDYKS